MTIKQKDDDKKRMTTKYDINLKYNNKIKGN